MPPAEPGAADVPGSPDPLLGNGKEPGLLAPLLALPLVALGGPDLATAPEFDGLDTDDWPTADPDVDLPHAVPSTETAPITSTDTLRRVNEFTALPASVIIHRWRVVAGLDTRRMADPPCGRLDSDRRRSHPVCVS